MSAASDWVMLTKARIQLFATPAAVVCAWIASDGELRWLDALHLVIGLTLVASASAVVNQLLEIRIDASMQRTQARPLPAGRVSPRAAATFGIAAFAGGAAWLLIFLNPLCAWLAVVMFASYCFIYTPLKRLTPLNTIVGAFPGALPLLVGYAAAGRGLDLAAGVLFLILFLWQLPHFFSIAWLYREDYARGGLQMLSNVDPSGAVSGRQAIHWALALVPASMLPCVFGIAGRLYFYAAFSLSILFLITVIGFGLRRSDRRARIVLWTSLAYLPLLFAFLVIDRNLRQP